MFAFNKIFIAKVLVANKVGGIKGSNRSKSMMPKTRKSEGQKLYKFKKPSKSRNLSKFAAKKVGSSFLTSNTRTFFNCL